MGDVHGEGGDGVADLELAGEVGDELAVAVGEDSQHSLVHAVESVGVGGDEVLEFVGIGELDHLIITGTPSIPPIYYKPL